MDCEEDDTSGNAVFSNHLIVSQIFPYLPLRDQMQLAKLNRTVRNNFELLFGSEKTCHFKSYSDISAYTHLPNNPGRHSKFVFDSCINLAAGLKIQPREREYFPVAPPGNTREEGDIVAKFFYNYAHRAVILEGFVAWREESEITELVKSFPNVIDLNLRIEQGPYIEPPSSMGNVFLNLKRLSLSIKFDERGVGVDLIVYYSIADNFADYIVTTFPNVEHLQISPWTGGCIEQVQAEMAAKIMDKTDRLTKLKQIACTAPENNGGLYLFRTRVPLERIEIIDSFCWTKGANEGLGAILEHHAESLESLKFPVNLVKYRKLNRDDRSNFLVPLSFTRLPNLTKLHLEFRIIKCISESAVFQLEFLHKINYSDMFPRLETLKIDVKSSHESNGSWVEAINNVFVTDQVCRSLRHLGIVQHFAPTDSEKLTEFMERIHATFPNVSHPILKERDGEKNESGIFKRLHWIDPMAELI